MGRHFKHPATIIATLALFVGLAGGAYAGGLINGSQIKNHSIATKKLTNAAVKQLQGATPKIVTFDATATSSAPLATPLGTFLGVTLSAACATTSGDAEILLNLNTSDGSWKTDAGQTFSPSGTASAGFVNVPAGTLTTPVPLTFTAAAGGNTHANYIHFIETGPSAGEMVWNLTVSTMTASPTCHFSIQYFPETVTAHTAASHAPASTTPASLRQLLHLGGLR